LLDHEMRLLGCGGSEIGAILGIDHNRDQFSVYADKVGLVPRVDNPNPRQRRGHYFEVGIAKLYADITGQRVEWFDTTIRHPTREYQCATPDAWVLDDDGNRIGLVDSKTAGLGATEDWGETGTDNVPEVVTLQGVWTASCAEMPWWDACALVRHLDDVRIYRIWRDEELERIILDAVKEFWYGHVIPRIPPEPGSSPATVDVIRRLYPKSVQPLRCATEAEYPLIARLREAKAKFRAAEIEKLAAEAAVKLAIGDADGLLAGANKITWLKNADTIRPDFRAIARELGIRLELLKPIVERALLNEAIRRSDASKALVRTDSDGGELCQVRDMLPPWWSDTMPDLEKQHEVVAKAGGRVLRVPRSWGSED
jgi:predicted phage-related endonuclease